MDHRRQEPKAFQLCLEILQHEHTNTPQSLQVMVQLMNQLPQSFHELIDLDLFKVSFFLSSFFIHLLTIGS
jgi:hypothetical protein